MLKSLWQLYATIEVTPIVLILTCQNPENRDTISLQETMTVQKLFQYKSEQIEILSNVFHKMGVCVQRLQQTDTNVCYLYRVQLPTRVDRNHLNSAKKKITCYTSRKSPNTPRRRQMPRLRNLRREVNKTLILPCLLTLHLYQTCYILPYDSTSFISNTSNQIDFLRIGLHTWHHERMYPSKEKPHESLLESSTQKEIK